MAQLLELHPIKSLAGKKGFMSFVSQLLARHLNGRMEANSSRKGMESSCNNVWMALDLSQRECILVPSLLVAPLVLIFGHLLFAEITSVRKINPIIPPITASMIRSVFIL